jgi:hypothetical protein
MITGFPIRITGESRHLQVFPSTGDVSFKLAAFPAHSMRLG